MGDAAMHIQALRATATLSILLWAKVAATNLGLGGAKLNAGGRAPEDTYQKSADEVTEESKVAQDRAQRIVNNDLENIPYTMVMAWGSMFCIYSMDNESVRDQHAMAQIILYSLFLVARIGHSVAYAKGLAYPRTAVWMLGFVITFAIGINGAVASFGVSS
uniref:Microsomal glutathione S-transferase 1 n=1 Tax=Minutocellus polymorphus TaxID=265543 RepID=A0A7S0FQL2_9STRA|mmetsp:Transcript_4499/g.7681  ORF Transcript_4499/g.7681 Transcript_4499/m.7681 type:complete len:161 (+) Transcript_4499:145-627(+)